MSQFNMASDMSAIDKLSEAGLNHDEAKKCLMPVGISTSENLVDKFKISRSAQD